MARLTTFNLSECLRRRTRIATNCLVYAIDEEDGDVSSSILVIAESGFASAGACGIKRRHSRLLHAWNVLVHVHRF